MLRKILIGVAALLALFVIVVATRPAAYRVERTLEIAAPPDRVFGVVNDLRRFAGVFVLYDAQFDNLAPEMFGGGAAGVGQSFAWSNDDVGKGTMTIEESVAGERVRLKLAIAEPMESTARVALRVARAPTGSAVTWSMEGEHNFIGKAVAMLADFDGMLGADIEKGLARLKSAAEKQ
jgi:hypothetical protein